MDFNKPYKLNKGDTVAIVAPSMFSEDNITILRGLKRLEDLGFKVIKGKTLSLRKNYMAGSDEERAADLMDMFLNPEVKCIISLMGGSVSNRILELLDYDAISRNPKIFSGMSDITTLHIALLAKAKIICLHQLDLFFYFGAEKMTPAIDYTLKLFLDITQLIKPLWVIPHYGNWETWRGGFCEGRLIGGWLPAIASIVNTIYWPKLNDKIILFWETIDIEVHSIERLLVSLRLAGVFENVCGMIVGQTPYCEEKEFKGLEPSIKEIVLDVTKNYGIPILGNVDFGHVDQNIPLPIGIKAQLNASNQSILLLENLVRSDKNEG